MTKRVPEIRFEGFTDDWEQRRLGDLGSFKNGMNFGKSAMGHGHPFINLQNIFGKTVVDDKDLGLAVSSEKQRNEYNLLKGDILFIRSSVKPEGVGEAALVPKNFENTTFSGFIIRFRPHITIDDEFKRVIFATKTVRNQIMALATSSANTNINQISLGKIIIELPELSEQSKIGNLFKQLDNAIALHQRKLEQLQSMKDGFLQKMFPKDGEKEPEIRFPGFTDDWEQREFKEILLVNSGRDYKHLEAGDIPVYGTGGYMLSVNDKLSDRDAIGLGRKGTIDKPQYLKAPFWTVDTLFYMIPKVNFDLLFLYSMTQKINWKRMDESTGVPSLSKAVIEKVKQRVPNIEEQSKIGKLFKQIDNIIALHQRELELLKQTKKAFLQKMFV